jgi:hypothetical protein
MKNGLIKICNGLVARSISGYKGSYKNVDIQEIVAREPVAELMFRYLRF